MVESMPFYGENQWMEDSLLLKYKSQTLDFCPGHREKKRASLFEQGSFLFEQKPGKHEESKLQESIEAFMNTSDTELEEILSKSDVPPSEEVPQQSSGHSKEKQYPTLTTQKEFDEKMGSIFHEDLSLSNLSEELQKMDKKTLRNIILSLAIHNSDLKEIVVATVSSIVSSNSNRKRATTSRTVSNLKQSSKEKKNSPMISRKSSQTNFMKNGSGKKTESPSNSSVKEREKKNPIKEGKLQMKIRGRWRRRVVHLFDEELVVFKKKRDNLFEEGILDLLGVSLKDLEPKDNRFSLWTMETKLLFSAPSQEEFLSWTSSLREVCEKIVNSIITNPSPRNSLGWRATLRSKKKCSSEEREQLIALNSICADCSAPNPEWVSINLGVVVCIDCSGAHRNLGTHISKMRSLKYDSLYVDYFEILKSLSNFHLNKFWECNISNNCRKPSIGDDIDLKHSYIRKKYENAYFARSTNELEYYRNIVDRMLETYLRMKTPSSEETNLS